MGSKICRPAALNDPAILGYYGFDACHGRERTKIHTNILVSLYAFHVHNNNFITFTLLLECWFSQVAGFPPWGSVAGVSPEISLFERQVSDKCVQILNKFIYLSWNIKSFYQNIAVKTIKIINFVKKIINFDFFWKKFRLRRAPSREDT